MGGGSQPIYVSLRAPDHLPGAWQHCPLVGSHVQKNVNPLRDTVPARNDSE